MKNRILKKIEYMVALVMLTGLLSGCDIIPTINLTSEQNEQISEYAAGLLMSYMQGHPNGMVPVDKSEMQLPEEEESETDIETDSAQDTESGTDMADEPIGDETSVEADAVAEEVPSDEAVVTEDGEAGEEAFAVDTTYVENPLAPMEEALGLSGVSLEYTGFEFAYEYPSSESEELTFSLQSAPGKKLLVVHFNVSNPNTDAISVSNVISNKKVRVIANGGQKIRAQKTILLNDLDSYEQTLESGASEAAVIVFEMDETMDENISSLVLSVISDGSVNDYPLI